MSSTRNEILNEFMQCIEEAMDLDSDDSEKAEILIELTELTMKATYLPKKVNKRQWWVKPWRNARNERGSFSFVIKELLLSNESSYRHYLRMSKIQFEDLLNLVEHDIACSNTKMIKAIKPAEKFALTLRYLATGETYQSLDYQSRISKTCISGIIPEVCEAIWKNLKGTYLKFSNSILEWECIAKEFALKWQFPNCLGALDGKHINFRSPRKDDANCKFIYVNIGCNGRNNDAGVFLQEGKEIPPNAVVGSGRSLPYVVVADDAFPMQTHLMKPYPYQTNSEDKQILNARITRARHVVEHAFGILSNIFKVFLTHINLKVDTVEKITFACCVLHNFLTISDETYLATSQILTNPKNNANNSTYNPCKGETETIRQQFMAYFNNERKLYWLQNK